MDSDKVDVLAGGGGGFACLWESVFGSFFFFSRAWLVCEAVRSPRRWWHASAEVSKSRQCLQRTILRLFEHPNSALVSQTS